MKLLIAMMTLIAVPAFATPVVKTVQCESTEGILLGQFEGSAVVTLNEKDNTAEGVLSLTVSRPGSEDLAVTGTMKGSYKEYDSSSVGAGKSTSVQLVDKGGRVSVAILNLGMAGPLTSTLIADGVTYKSACN